MKRIILILLLGLSVQAFAQEKSHFAIQSKYSELLPVSLYIGGGAGDHDEFLLGFGIGQPRTGNAWGDLLPAPEGSSPQQPPQQQPPSPPSPPSGGQGQGQQPQQPQQPQPPKPSMPDVKINGKAMQLGVTHRHWFTSWVGLYDEVGICWIKSMPDGDGGGGSSSDPPPQKQRIYFCVPVEGGAIFKLGIVTFSGGYQFHYKGYAGWTAGFGFSF